MLNIVTIAKTLEGFNETYLSCIGLVEKLPIPCKYIIVFDSFKTLQQYESSYARLSFVICCVQTGHGISNAFNSALPYFVSGYSLFINSGDYINPNLTLHDLKNIAHYLSSDYDLVVCRCLLLPDVPMPPIYVSFLSRLASPFIRARIPHQATFTHTRMHVLKFSEDLRVRMDYCFFYTHYTSRKVSTVYLPILLSFMTPGGISSMQDLSYIEERRVHLKLDHVLFIHQLRIYATYLVKRLLH